MIFKDLILTLIHEASFRLRIIFHCTFRYFYYPKGTISTFLKYFFSIYCLPVYVTVLTGSKKFHNVLSSVHSAIPSSHHLSLLLSLKYQALFPQ